MKITQPTLNAALRGLRIAKPRHTTLAVLECVQLATNGRAVTLATTDLDQRLTYTGELAEATQPTVRLVPFALLQRIAKEMPKEAVLSFARDGQISCAAGNITTLVPYEAVGPEEYPPALAVEGDEIELPPAALAALQDALPVASDDAKRRSIGAVCLESTGVVATDGRQLFHANTLSLPLPEPRSFPTHKTLAFFDSALPATLRLPGKKKSHIFTLRQGPWIWQAKFIDEAYPNWRKVLQVDEEKFTRIKLSSEDVAHLRHIIGLIPREPRHTPSMAFVIRHEKLVAVTRPGEHAQTHELNPLQVIGADAHSWFDANFLLRALDYGFVEMRWRDNRSVFIARGEHREYLFMPLGIEDEKLPENLRPPAALPTAGPTTPNTPTTPTQTNNPPMNTSTANTDHTAKTETPPVAPANGQGLGNGQPPPANGGNPTPGAEDSSDHLLLRLQQARESLGAALDLIGEVKGAVRGIVRQHRALEREHEGLKRSLRAIQKMEV